jgi:hypothetical protein
MSISEDQIKALTGALKTQIVDDAKQFITNIKDDDQEFFGDVAKRLAKNYVELKFGDEDRKAIVQENIEALNRGMASRVASSGIDFAEHGKDQVIGILQTVGKTVLTIALSVV